MKLANNNPPPTKNPDKTENLSKYFYEHNSFK